MSAVCLHQGEGVGWRGRGGMEGGGGGMEGEGVGWRGKAGKFLCHIHAHEVQGGGGGGVVESHEVTKAFIYF